jgi:hypothetical protein
MSYSKNYFDKENITDITYQDVVNYFTIEREESDKIEYKSFVVNEKGKEITNGVLKTICAFLNSEGGLLIWGAPIGQQVEGKKEKIFIGNLSPVEHLYEKDQFISKISDSISPTPKGILFHRIEKDKKFIYIFEVPKSEYSPHQFGDKFYMRIDGQTKTAPYHYIEALFKKISYPNLQGFLKLEGWHLDNSIYYLTVSPYIFNFSKLQNDYNLSFRLLSDSGIFADYFPTGRQDPNVKFANNGHEKNRLNIKDVIYYGEPVHDRSTFKFEPKTLVANNWEVEVVLTFGAKYSPMKMCYYKLRLPTTSNPKDLQSCIIEKKENQSMRENSDKNDDELVEYLIGRKI